MIKKIVTLLVCLAGNYGSAWAANEATGVVVTKPSDPPIVVETINRFADDGAKLSELWRVTVPQDPTGSDAWVFTYNGAEVIGLGYRTRLLDGKDLKWQRFFVTTKDLHRVTGVWAESFAAGKAGNQPYTNFVSLRFPTDDNPRIYSESLLQLGKSSEVASLWLVGEYAGEWDQWSLDQMKFGSELQYKLRGMTLKGRCMFDTNGNSQFQLWTNIPVK